MPFNFANSRHLVTYVGEQFGSWGSQTPAFNAMMCRWNVNKYDLVEVDGGNRGASKRES